jgi:xanthine dehydrogenase YagT iron-sulfur-binding subunit
MSQPSASSGTALSRRSFVTGTVSTVAAMPLIGSSAQAEEPGRRVAQLRQPIVTSLQINKQRYELSLDPRTSLLDALRDHAELTGTKKGCDHGQCGACTVLVDGKRVLSCLSFAWMNDSKQITTVEGLASTEGELHPMQQAFIDHDAFQCGYCTPGQIMSAIGCVNEGHAQSEDDIREYMSGNICRCAGYPNIVAAILQARDQMKGE